MDWTLQKIELENFKFFKKPFELPLDGKNILLYGENGSGKSSIVWGLYTLMESHKKAVADVQKYFDPNNDQHLRNRYSARNDHSSIRTTFVPVANGNPPKDYEISDTRISTQTAGDDFIRLTTAAFDMFNYRMLSDWIYQKNSRSIDLFGGFEKDIFKYLYFSRAYECVDGTVPAQDGKTAEEWWQYIKSVRLPLTRRGQVNRGTPEYTRFMTLLRDFKNEMDAVLMQVERSANNMLHDDLELRNIAIQIDMSDVPFNLLKPNCKRYKDGKVHNPAINVTANMIDINVPGWTTDIKHLATFFNESKLTCIGIALRLAISDYKLITMGDVAPVLCIDDLLLSLDMSARIPIIKLLLKKSNDRQMMVFTHDWAFFDTMNMFINEAGKQGEWKLYEMNEKESRQLRHAPEPLFLDSMTYREKAEKHIESGDYPAAANYLRKYCEKELKQLLPNNLLLKPKSNGEIEMEDLNGMIGKFENRFCSLYNIPVALLPSLSVYRKRLLNPLSHDDAQTPVYKAEIRGAMAEIDKIKTIADSIKEICKGEGVHRDEFVMTVSNVFGTITEIVQFDVMERWTSIEVEGNRYYKDVKIKVLSSTTAAVIAQEYDSLRDVFNTVCIALGLNTPPAAPPALESTIENRHTGKALSAI